MDAIPPIPLGQDAGTDGDADDADMDACVAALFGPRGGVMDLMVMDLEDIPSALFMKLKSSSGPPELQNIRMVASGRRVRWIESRDGAGAAVWREEPLGKSTRLHVLRWMHLFELVCEHSIPYRLPRAHALAAAQLDALRTNGSTGRSLLDAFECYARRHGDFVRISPVLRKVVVRAAAKLARAMKDAGSKCAYTKRAFVS